MKPNVTLQLLGQDAPPEILFGKDTAIEGKKEYIRARQRQRDLRGLERPAQPGLQESR